jgi:gliding motility-associated-like protein
MNKSILIFFLIGSHLSIYGQDISFRKFMITDTIHKTMRAFSGCQAADGGYLATGIGKFGTLERPFLIKLDCKGNTLWSKNYGTADSWNNIQMKVINTHDKGCILLTAIGAFNNYNILVIKYGANGSADWSKVINNGVGNDMGHSIQQNVDSSFIICGATSTYGSDAGSNNYTDAYLIKLSSSGSVIFSKTFGKKTGVDAANDVVPTHDSGYAFTGTFLDKGCFNIGIGKVDSAGNLLFFKMIGDTLSRNAGFRIVENSSGELFVFGSTTLHNPSPSFNSDISHILLKVSTTGNLLWSRVFNGSNNGSDNSLSMCLAKNGSIVLGTETMSYPSTGFTPNKQVAHVFDDNGNLLKSIGYNTTGSQYPAILKAQDAGYTLAGFGTINSPTSQRIYLFKMDSLLQTTCVEDDLTGLTQIQNAAILQWDFVPIVAGGNSIVNYSTQQNFIINDSTLCENYPLLDASFTKKDTCFGVPVLFSANKTNALLYIWVLGNGDTVTTATNTLTYEYNQSGNFVSKLFLTDGCDTSSTSQNISVKGASNLQISTSNNAPTSGETIILNTNIPLSNILWSDGSSSSSININTAGQYWVSGNVAGCKTSDTIQIVFGPATQKGTVYIPNAITPNNDDLNDDLEITVTGAYRFKKIQVYNRWGKRVFESTDINKRFNGLVSGDLGGIETYFYYAVFDVFGKEEIFKGDISVLR